MTTAAGTRIRSGSVALTTLVAARGDRQRRGSAVPGVLKGPGATTGSRSRRGFCLPQIRTLGSSLTRWRFDDLVDGSNWVFEINPSAGGAATAKRNVHQQPTTASDGNTLVYEGDDDLAAGEFVGMVWTQSHYDRLKVWMDKPHPVVLTDDLMRRSVITITKLAPVRKPTAHGRFRQEVTVSYLILKLIDP